MTQGIRAHWLEGGVDCYHLLVISLGQEDPLEKGMATHSSILPGEFHGQRSLAGYSPWGWSPSGRNRGLPLRRRRGQGPHLAKRWVSIVSGQGQVKSSGPLRWGCGLPSPNAPGTPSFPSQPEGKIGLPRANPRGRLRSPS